MPTNGWDCVMELRSTNIQTIQYYRCVYVYNRRCEPGCTIYIIFVLRLYYICNKPALSRIMPFCITIYLCWYQYNQPV